MFKTIQWLRVRFEILEIWFVNELKDVGHSNPLLPGIKSYVVEISMSALVGSVCGTRFSSTRRRLTISWELVDRMLLNLGYQLKFCTFTYECVNPACT